MGTTVCFNIIGLTPINSSPNVADEPHAVVLDQTDPISQQPTVANGALPMWEQTPHGPAVVARRWSYRDDVLGSKRSGQTCAEPERLDHGLRSI